MSWPWDDLCLSYPFACIVYTTSPLSFALGLFPTPKSWQFWYLVWKMKADHDMLFLLFWRQGRKEWKIKPGTQVHLAFPFTPSLEHSVWSQWKPSNVNLKIAQWKNWSNKDYVSSDAFIRWCTKDCGVVGGSICSLCPSSINFEVWN